MVRFKRVFTAETIETVERDGRTGLALNQILAYLPLAPPETPRHFSSYESSHRVE